MISGFSEAHAERIQQARAKGPFRSLEDFTRRTRLSRTVVAKLARADALASLGRNRRQALWEALSQEESSRELPLFDSLEREDEQPVELPALQPLEEVFRDYETTGLSLKAHPISFYRARLDQLGVTPAGQLPTIRNNQLVRVAGLVLLRQRPSTAKGITFVTLEDETGTANLVIRQPIWQRYYAVARRSPAWIAHGKLECEQSVIHVVVNRMEDFAEATGNPSHSLQTKARDFR